MARRHASGWEGYPAFSHRVLAFIPACSGSRASQVRLRPWLVVVEGRKDVEVCGNVMIRRSTRASRSCVIRAARDVFGQDGNVAPEGSFNAITVPCQRPRKPLSRTVAMIANIAPASFCPAEPKDAGARAGAGLSRYRNNFDEYNFSRALENVWVFRASTNTSSN